MSMPALTQKSQVTIPLAVRKLLGLSPGDEVEFSVKGAEVVLRRREKLSVIDKYRGFLGQGSTDAVMRELR